MKRTLNENHENSPGDAVGNFSKDDFAHWVRKECLKALRKGFDQRDLLPLVYQLVPGAKQDERERLLWMYLRERFRGDNFLNRDQCEQLLSKVPPEQRKKLAKDITKLQDTGCSRHVIMLLLFQFDRALASPAKSTTIDDARSIFSGLQDLLDGITAFKRLLACGGDRKIEIDQLADFVAGDLAGASKWNAGSVQTSRLASFVDLTRRMSQERIPQWLVLLFLLEREHLLESTMFRSDTLRSLRAYISRIDDWWTFREDTEVSYLRTCLTAYPFLVCNAYHHELIADILNPFQPIDADLVAKNQVNFCSAHPVLAFLICSELQSLHSKANSLRAEILPSRFHPELFYTNQDMLEMETPNQILENSLPEYFYDFS
jgi:hypothetical protein